jgi:hypothetical protein
VSSEQENTGEVKITKRFGLEGQWETFSHDELEQKVTEGEYRVMDTPDGSTAATPVNGNTAVKSGWHTLDLKQVVDSPNAEAESLEYYSSPEGLANLMADLSRMEEEANNELFLEWQCDCPRSNWAGGTVPNGRDQPNCRP